MGMKICAKCCVELVPHRVGVTVVEHVLEVGPYRIWQADLWKCPKCKVETILNFADKAVEHWQSDFDKTLKWAEKRPFLYNVYVGGIGQ